MKYLTVPSLCSPERTLTNSVKFHKVMSFQTVILKYHNGINQNRLMNSDDVLTIKNVCGTMSVTVSATNSSF